MTGLLDLAAELLLQILEDLGPDFFRQDVGRLAVCKRWHALAWPTFIAELNLSASATSRLAHISKRSTFLTPLRHSAKTARLSLHGDNDPLGSSSCTNPPSPKALESHFQDKVTLDERSARLNAPLQALSSILPPQTTTRLRSLQLKVHGGNIPPSYLPLHPAPILSLVSIASLTSLDLDLAGHVTFWPEQTHNPEVHLCAVLNRMLPQLVTLRCRIGSMCEHLLHPPAGDEGEQGKPLKRMKELIVNASIPSGAHYRYPFGCRRPRVDVKAMKRQMERLALMMSEPRLVRLMCHVVDYDVYQLYAMDIVPRGRFVLMRADDVWDAAGGERMEDPFGGAARGW
ncbi:hypothetical protein B0T22DRAFT_489340 [Podospora appendiculata]|uniref:F-box domain-containing protein n=1 Tax=Podospora appendiculata TaxID=314037 RepID=A0AAE1CBI0_9PEZI|nr:hypothetical protein B0T22DRAFT_489340 [Podospora appendiculata]